MIRRLLLSLLALPLFASAADTPPNIVMIITPITCAVIGAVLPFSPLADTLGFTTLPISFFLILVGMIVTYLALVESAKHRFYAAQAHPHRAPLTHEQRHQRHVNRRVARYAHHTVRTRSRHVRAGRR